MATSQARQAPRTQFFFEKKNQKTLAPSDLYPPAGRVNHQNKSFLVLFFKKELLPVVTPCRIKAIYLLCVLCTAPALADPPAQSAPQSRPAQQPDKPAAAKVQQVSKANAEGLLGHPVDDGKGNVVGHIVDVLIDDTGKPKAAVIDFAGFFGFGNRQIAVDWQALGFSPANNRIDISIHLDADKLKAMPEYHPEATSVPVVTQGATHPH